MGMVSTGSITVNACFVLNATDPPICSSHMQTAGTIQEGKEVVSEIEAVEVRHDSPTHTNRRFIASVFCLDHSGFRLEGKLPCKPAFNIKHL